MNGKIEMLALAVAVMIAASGMAAITTFALDTAPQPIRVACVGDSITQGSGYPAKLQLLLGPEYNVQNFGVCGSTVSLTSILPYMNQSAFRKAEEFDPEIVVIMLGTNDANPDIAQNEDNFEIDYAQLVTSFENLDGDQSIWVVKSPPIFSVDSAYNNTYLNSTIFQQVETIADQMNLSIVDIYSAFGNHSDYFMDGVHPNRQGADLIASNVYDAITSPYVFSAEETMFDP
jgi:lysophospholipase L1-like esterase